MGVSASVALEAAADRLQTALFGLEDMRQRPQRYVSGLMNAVTFGRMVTLALQNMRGCVVGWEEWYATKQDEMSRDPLMTYFIGLRNRIEKQTSGRPVIAGRFSFNTNDLAQFEPAPPGADSFLMGSAKHGGASGWLVVLPDGEQQLYAVDVPNEMAEFVAHLPDAPDGWAGTSAADMVEAYLGRLKSLLDDAKRKFPV